MPNRKIPTKLKALRGTLEKYYSTPNEPEPETLVDTEPPKGLVGNEKTLWNELSHQLLKCDILTVIDTEALKQLCRISVLYDKEFETLQEEGFIVQTLSSTKQNPRFGVCNELLKQIIRLYQEFGMTPASRTKISATVDPKKKKQAIPGQKTPEPPLKTGTDG